MCPVTKAEHRRDIPVIMDRQGFALFLVYWEERQNTCIGFTILTRPCGVGGGNCSALRANNILILFATLVFF